MRFNTVEFLAFFAVFSLIYHGLLRDRVAKLWCITVGSLIFYAGWDYRFVPVLLFTALVDFALAGAIGREKRRKARLAYLWASISCNLLVLCVLKYANFFLGSAFGLLHLTGLSQALPPVLAITLPVGISFYTLQSMSYVIDVYRGDMKARRRPVELLAGVSFFPHLVSGPIIRATTLLPQFERPRFDVDQAMLREGALLFAIGLLKKGIGDLLSAYVGPVFDGNGQLGVLQNWIGTLAFTGQIYADFSGYTDMAIGIALSLGFRLPANFNLPFLAKSPSDFWKRWHISLSTWLRDYLYIPLGGKRTHHYRNLIITMLLGGLWHGADSRFLIWGGYHSLALVAENLIKGTSLASKISGRISRVLGTLLTFYIVHVGLILFRAPSTQVAWRIWRRMHSAGLSAGPGVSLADCGLVVGGLVFCHLISRTPGGTWLPERHATTEWAAIGAVFGVGLLVGLGVLSSGFMQPFIYFQF